MTQSQIQKYVEDRTIEEAYYIVQHQATIRQAASKFNIAKSALHRDVTERLPELNHGLYELVKKVLEYNKETVRVKYNWV